MKQNKKGMSLNDLLPVVLLFVIVGIAVTIGLSIQANVQSDQTASSSAYNASQDAIDANVTIASYLPTLGLVVAAAIIIGVLVTLLMRK